MPLIHLFCLRTINIVDKITQIDNHGIFVSESYCPKTMNIKFILKEITPPLIYKFYKSSKKIITSSLVQGKERSSNYYDKAFLNDRWYEHYSNSEYYSLWTIIEDRISRYLPRLIIDIGCGPGQFAAFLSDKKYNNYVGLDFSKTAIEQAKKINPQFEFLIADVFETDLLLIRDYDLVVCTEVLEHVENDFKILQGIKKGTRFLGTVPNFPFPSHVRYFNDATEVYARYNKFFNKLDVKTHIADSKGTLFFLMDGVII
jgi:SAM-dependent methyltransferase